MWTEKDYIDCFVDEVDRYLNNPTTREQIEKIVRNNRIRIVDDATPVYYGQCVDLLKEMEYYDWSKSDFSNDTSTIRQVAFNALDEGFGEFEGEIIDALCEKYDIE